MTNESNAIDIVLPWVDGEDPRLKAERMKYMSERKDAHHEDVAGNSRYTCIGEIKYCIASINMFAPFIRKIFIVTDGQNPDLLPFLEKNFPQGHIPIEIVDHKVIFKGYEQYLPVFNSRAIETMIWKIPGLSERFILMNDDFVLTGHVKPEDFFRGDKTVCYGTHYPTLWANMLGLFRRRLNGCKRISFKESMIKAAEIMGRRHSFIYLGHTPRALRRSFYESFFSDKDDIIERNLTHRFRHYDQYNSQELFYISEFREGRCIVTPHKRKLLYLMPKKRPGYIDRKMKRLDRKTEAVFCCINTLSLASERDQAKVLEWIEKKLGQNLQLPR